MMKMEKEQYRSIQACHTGVGYGSSPLCVTVTQSTKSLGCEQQHSSERGEILKDFSSLRTMLLFING